VQARADAFATLAYVVHTLSHRASFRALRTWEIYVEMRTNSLEHLRTVTYRLGHQHISKAYFTWARRVTGDRTHDA
jgi:hypothetical protein